MKYIHITMVSGSIIESRKKSKVGKIQIHLNDKVNLYTLDFAR